METEAQSYDQVCGHIPQSSGCGLLWGQKREPDRIVCMGQGMSESPERQLDLMAALKRRRAVFCGMGVAQSHDVAEVNYFPKLQTIRVSAMDFRFWNPM